MIRDLAQVIDNARSFIGQGWTYKLGGDSEKKKEIDCSAFVWRCLGDRKYDKSSGVWRNTSWLASSKALAIFDRLDEPVPGCIAVYGWSKYPNGKGKPGHCAIVVDPAAHTVIDASSSTNTVKERRVDRFWFPSKTQPKTYWLVPKGAEYVEESEEDSEIKNLTLVALAVAGFWAFYASR